MAVDGHAKFLQVTAGAALNSGDGTGCQYKAVVVAGTIAADNSAIGILYNKPKSGEDAQVLYEGHGKGTASASIAAGARVKVTTSGYLVTVSSGDGACGKAVTAAASGAAVECIFNFPSAAITY
jgi:hypothetical protein